MASYKTRLDQNGRIVVPAPIRKLLGVKPGDELVLDTGADEVRLTSHRAALRGLKRLVREQLVRPYSIKEFLADRRGEADADELAWKRRRSR